MEAGRQTTSPARSTRESVVGDAGLCLLFVHPRIALLPLGAEPVVLGRADDCAFQLEGTEASRHHAELKRDGPLLLLRDLGSRNGSFVSGEPVKRPMPLAPGSVVRLGEWVGVIVAPPSPLDGASAFGALAPGLFAGPTLAAALCDLRSAAASELPIVIEGETGTGKECVAHAVHEWSGRGGPFLAVNCSALPEALAEAELFGYRKGAFTGADRNSQGHFRAADGGTLLLDEVIELPLPLQAKLLRVLEQREVLPLGESRPVGVNVRVVTAAQEPLGRAVKDGRFRADLYARLAGLGVKLPALRQRREEVAPLFVRFLAEAAGRPAPALTPKLVERLCLYDWPFNVRELRLLVQRIVALHSGETTLHRRHLPAHVRDPEVEPASIGTAPAEGAGPKDLLTRLLAALRTHDGVVARAAQQLGISRQRAYRLMQAHPEVDLERLRGEGGGRP